MKNWQKTKRRKELLNFLLSIICFVIFYIGWITLNKALLAFGPLWLCMYIISGWIEDAKEEILQRMAEKGGKDEAKG